MITIPTISTLYTQIKTDLEGKFGETIPVFGKIFLNALAGVQAAKLKIYYLAIAALQRNIFPDTADPESIGGTLERFGRVKLGRNPFAATAGQYTIQVTGTIGAIIEAGTTFISDDESTNPGKLFILDSEVELTNTVQNILVRALEAGLDSKMEVGEGLTSTIPIAGVDRAAEVVTETVAPLAAEEIEDYREKTLVAFRTEPNGGSAADYRLWAQDAQGVQQVYPYAKTGSPGEINLYVEATIADSTDGKGTPTSAILEEVEEVVEFDPDTTKPIEERGRRPLSAFQINYIGVTPRNVEVTINGYVNSTSEIETLIEDALTEAINRIRPFVAGADILTDKNDILDLNKIIGTIIAAKPGSIFDSVDLEIDGSPVTSFTFTNGDIPYVDSITFA